MESVQNNQEAKIEKLTKKNIKTLSDDEIVDRVMSKILEIK